MTGNAAQRLGWVPKVGDIVSIRYMRLTYEIAASRLDSTGHVELMLRTIDPDSANFYWPFSWTIYEWNADDIEPVVIL